VPTAAGGASWLGDLRLIWGTHHQNLAEFFYFFLSRGMNVADPRLAIFSLVCEGKSGLETFWKGTTPVTIYFYGKI
jgi:hypothetical protein